MKQFLIKSLLILTIIVGGACSKLLDVQSTRVVPEDNMWLKLEDARAGLVGVYALSRAALADNNRYWIYGDVRGGDFTGVSRPDLKAIHNNELNTINPLINELSDWRRFYAAINAANLFIERAHEVYEKDPRYTQQNLNVDVAQAHALRAWNYFYMVRIWGDVPLITSSHDGQYENKPREDQQKVLAFAEQELVATIPVLPMAYDGTWPEQTGSYYSSELNMFMRKRSVWAVLAHVYAWEGKYAQSAQYSKLVLDNISTLGGGFTVAMYPLTVTQISSVFMGALLAEKASMQFGFPHLHRNGDATFTGNLESLTLAYPLIPNKTLPEIYVPKDSILSIFNEYNDLRFSMDSIFKKQSTATPWYFANFDQPVPVFRKVFVYDWYELPSAVTINMFPIFASTNVIIRLEDIGLLLAEAKYALNDITGAKAQLDIIRVKRGLPTYDLMKNPPSLIDAIFKERQRELMGEGWRWFDLIRLKKLKNNDPVFNKLIQDGGIYWPIAKNLLVQNPLLKQNAYWY